MTQSDKEAHKKQGSDETIATQSHKTELCRCCSIKEVKWPQNISPWNFGQDKLLKYIPKIKWFVTVQQEYGLVTKSWLL